MDDCYRDRVFQLKVLPFSLIIENIRFKIRFFEGFYGVLAESVRADEKDEDYEGEICHGCWVLVINNSNYYWKGR